MYIYSFLVMLAACVSAGPSLWFKLKYLNNFWMDSQDFFYSHGAWKMNPQDFGDSLTFRLVPLSDQNVHVSNTLVYD